MPRTAGTLQGTRERTKQEKGKPQKCGEQDTVTREPDKQRDLTPPGTSPLCDSPQHPAVKEIACKLLLTETQETAQSEESQVISKDTEEGTAMKAGWEGSAAAATAFCSP